MRTAVGAVFFLVLLQGQALGQCPAVQELHFQRSSRNIRIRTVIQGKDAKGVRVRLVQLASAPGAGSKEVYSAISDDEGVVVPPEVAPGRYELEAAIASGLSDVLLLDIRDNASPSASTYSMNLAPRGATIWYRLNAAGEKKPDEVVRRFAGVVEGAESSVLPAVKIDVWKAGALNDAPVSEVVSANDGRFAVGLPEGLYVAAFRLNGFQDQIVAVEIRGNSRAPEFRLSMKKGETVYVCS